MNKYQAEVEKQLIQNEKEILEQLKHNYANALKDIRSRIKELSANELTQSKIYQIQYQETLEKQLKAIVDLLSSDNVKSINDYLIRTYNDGFIGTLYNMQKEGVPFIMTINQNAVVKSISKQTADFKLSKTLYQNANELKKTIKSEITRGISQGASYSSISKKIAMGGETDLKKAYRIARTEGGRVQSEAKFEAMTRAKANGADIVKQWDSTMDSRTRPTHVMLDGQIRELEELFEVDGNQAMYPHDFGIASEDINCRCVVLERARWAVEDEKDYYKRIDGDLVQFKNTRNYQEYKEKYFKFYENYDKIGEIKKEVKEKVQYIGKLDKNKLGEYADKVTTENVIMTGERVEHTKVRHPGDYEKYIQYVPDIIKEPAYYLEDKDNEDTILALKTIYDEKQKANKNIIVVVKLNTNIDESDLSNSILTFWHTRNRSYKSVIKNNKIIYEKLDKNE